MFVSKIDFITFPITVAFSSILQVLCHLGFVNISYLVLVRNTKSFKNFFTSFKERSAENIYYISSNHASKRICKPNINAYELVEEISSGVKSEPTYDFVEDKVSQKQNQGYQAVGEPIGVTGVENDGTQQVMDGWGVPKNRSVVKGNASKPHIGNYEINDVPEYHVLEEEEPGVPGGEEDENEQVIGDEYTEVENSTEKSNSANDQRENPTYRILEEEKSLNVLSEENKAHVAGKQTDEYAVIQKNKDFSKTRKPTFEVQKCYDNYDKVDSVISSK